MNKNALRFCDDVLWSVKRDYRWRANLRYCTCCVPATACIGRLLDTHPCGVSRAGPLNKKSGRMLAHLPFGANRMMVQDCTYDVVVMDMTLCDDLSG